MEEAYQRYEKVVEMRKTLTFLGLVGACAVAEILFESMTGLRWIDDITFAVGIFAIGIFRKRKQ